MATAGAKSFAQIVASNNANSPRAAPAMQKSKGTAPQGHETPVPKSSHAVAVASVSVDRESEQRVVMQATIGEQQIPQLEHRPRIPQFTIPNDEADMKLVEAVKAMHFRTSTPDLVVNGFAIPSSHGKHESGVLSEDVSTRADSTSDLGTKPSSLDGKSNTSGTTFALDEKESLRPDDSASVQAAEEDDALSGKGSILTGSRIGSEAAVHAPRAQITELSVRRNNTSSQDPVRQAPRAPQQRPANQRTSDENQNPAIVEAGEHPSSFNLFYKQTPDEKLLEALDSPKDRIFLLRLEQSLIGFVKHSKDSFMDLPPCNSFCRMLTHKLADYYHMTHQVDAVQGAVRIFRTPFCRLPASLTSISTPSTTGSTPPPLVVPTMKIMRRVGAGDSGSSPSKATSEVGSDGKEKSASAKEKLSREEREALYQKARERIFGKEDHSGQATPDTEGSNDLSRSSSISTKDKAPNRRGKTGKQRRDDSESFDVRSQYMPFYQTAQQASWQMRDPYGMGPMDPYSGNQSNIYQQAMPAPYGMTSPQYSGQALLTDGMPSFAAHPYTAPGPGSGMSSHVSPMSPYSTMMHGMYGPPQSHWSSNMYPDDTCGQGHPNQRLPYDYFRARAGYPNPADTTYQAGVPQYPYGQLPTMPNAMNQHPQHPIPGSFNRQAFDPKTQSFMPGTSGVQPAQSAQHNKYAAHGQVAPGQDRERAFLGAQTSSHHSVHEHSQHAAEYMAGASISAQTSFKHAMQPDPNRSHAATFPVASPSSTSASIQHMTTPHSSHRAHDQIPSTAAGSRLPQFGNPATLPPKPPTGR